MHTRATRGHKTRDTQSNRHAQVHTCCHTGHAPLGAKAPGHVVSLHDHGKAQVAQVGAADTGRVLVHLDRWVGSGWGREAGKGMEHCKNNWIGGRRARGVMGAHSEEEG